MPPAKCYVAPEGYILRYEWLQNTDEALRRSNNSRLLVYSIGSVGGNVIGIQSHSLEYLAFVQHLLQMRHGHVCAG